MARMMTHGEAVEAVSRLFRERGPVLGRRLRRDFEAFLSDRSIETLAMCLAKNGVVVDEAAFAAWCAEPPSTSQAALGMGQSGFLNFVPRRGEDSACSRAR